MPKTRKIQRQTEANRVKANAIRESLFANGSTKKRLAIPEEQNIVEERLSQESFFEDENQEDLEGQDIEMTSEMVQSIKDECLRLNFMNVKSIIPPTNMFWFSNFPIPSNFKEVFAYGLQANLAINYKHLQLINTVKDTLMSKLVDRSNYEQFFRIVLWMEEIKEEDVSSQYNLKKVTMTRVNDLFYLEVKGLAKKRPSLLINEVVNIKVHGSFDIIYKGLVNKILDRKIRIGSLDDMFIDMVSKNSSIEFDVAFQLNRITYERMHFGLHCIGKKPYLMDTLFPLPTETAENCGNFKITSENDVFNKDTFRNNEQVRAIENIINGTSGRSPYIVFGPPGTGKTVILVESILQIKNLPLNGRFNSTILVCAQSNATCDMLTEKLIPWCRKHELIRVHSSTSSWDSISRTVKEYSNWKDGKYVGMCGYQLRRYRIVVTTLATSGRFLQNPPSFQPRYIFIDEAAQASEPEAVTAVALLGEEFHLVLAGDSNQLGPLVISKKAKKYGLGVSLLERLMKITDVYGNDNANCVSILALNYRSHPNILALPNKLFYKNQLQAISPKALNDPIAATCVYCKMNPSFEKTFNYKKCSVATEFYAVFSEEKKDFYSSYFNLEEINMVVKTIKALCTLKDIQVDQKDIGVITPYNTQVYKIKKALKTEGFAGIEVGSTEVFQGREKRIIIISTVRAKMSLLSLDRTKNLGFIDDPRRFNVALTRAMSKLIVIGCPTVLQCDKKYWMKYVNYCLKNNSYFGEPFVKKLKSI